ncbi:hypothetical protein HPB52_009514 [Rhipicephalus sanguineus]|uniref:DUF6570 domain-containing protein n=1 Tax=Rhipicephalus sanguineus TaxID=34632 RepID=A0A9D4SR74_RHISA|nr:hypothetical protein HPB52_009514 [Rhipicephalus sanguineus]
MKGRKRERRSKSKGKGRKSSSKRTSPAESVASSPSEASESVLWTQASVGTRTEGEDEPSRAHTNTGTAFQAENRLSGDEGPTQSTVSSALSSDTTSQATPAGQTTPRVMSQRHRAISGPDVSSTKRPSNTQGIHRAESVQPDTRNRAAAKAPSAAAGVQKAFSDSDLVALSTTMSTTAGDVSPSSTRNSSTSQSRTSSLRKRKKIRVPGFFRMRDRHHRHHDKHKVLTPTSPTPKEHDRAMGKKKPTAAVDTRVSQESGTPIRHSVTLQGKYFEEKAISRPEAPSAFTPVVRHRENAEDSLPKKSTFPGGPQTPVSEAASRDRTMTLSPPLSPTLTSTPLRSPGTSWTSIITRDTSGRTTPRTAAILSLLRRASRDVPSPATEGQNARSLKCLDRLSTVSEIRWACDDDEPRLDASAAVLPAASSTTPEARSRSKRVQGKNVYFSDERDDPDLLRVPDVPLSAAPYNIRSSKLPRFMNLKDTHPGHPYRKSIIAVMVLSPVLIFVFLIAALVLKQHSGLRRLKMFHVTDDLKKSCRNGNNAEAAISGCLLAVEQMSYDMDWFGDPCLELDQFVCGKWRSWNPYRGTYRQNDHGELKLCRTFRETVVRGPVPQFSVTNAFKYRDKPASLPRLFELEERMVSPRIPFMNIRRLTHGYGQYGIRGNVIYMRIDVQETLKLLPRSVPKDAGLDAHF